MEHLGHLKKKMPRYKKDDIITAIQAHKGNISEAAKSIGCSRTTFYRFIERYDDVKQVFDDINETTIDKVENKMMDLIEEGNTTLIIFYLKTKGKHRGYSERFEHTGKDGNEIEHKHTIDYSQMSDDELRKIASGK